MLVAGGWDGQIHLNTIELILLPAMECSGESTRTLPLSTMHASLLSTPTHTLHATHREEEREAAGQQESGMRDCRLYGWEGGGENTAEAEEERRRADRKQQLLAQHQALGLLCKLLAAHTKRLLKERFSQPWEMLALGLLANIQERARGQERKDLLERDREGIEDRNMERERDREKMKRSVESITADQAAARAEHQEGEQEREQEREQVREQERGQQCSAQGGVGEGNRDGGGGVGSRGGYEVSQMHPTPPYSILQEKAQVLEQCVAACMAEHRILAQCLVLELSDDDFPAACTSPSLHPSLVSNYLPPPTSNLIVIQGEVASTEQQEHRITGLKTPLFDNDSECSTGNKSGGQETEERIVAALTEGGVLDASVTSQQEQDLARSFQSSRVRRKCARALLRPASRLTLMHQVVLT